MNLVATRLVRHHATAILLFALLLTLPAILSPAMTHDSFWITWTWADQFNAELARGELYPRWLPQSHGGLGSPVFYYYPPLAFYVSGLFGLAGLSTYGSIIAAYFVGLAASGFAMYAWLRESARAPLGGALLYMAAPYHLLDFYGRGAFAEFMATALIPLLALGLRRATEGRFALAALAFGAMILTHPPLALLVSLFFVAPYALVLARGAPRLLLRIAVPLLIGLALSAVYLVPALGLEPYRDAAKFWELATFKAENWSLLRWNVPGPSPHMRSAIAAVLLVLAYASVLLLFMGQRRWGAYALFCCVLAAGLIPGFWHLPLLYAVQFPFRLLPLAEFAIATATAHLLVPRAFRGFVPLPMLALSVLYAAVHPKVPEVTMRELVASHPDVPENLPPGERPYSWPSRWALDVARAHPHAKQIGGRTIEPTFYFPAWEVRCGGQRVPAFPEARTRLLSYQGEGCERRLTTTVVERLGTLITLGGILMLLSLAAARRRLPRIRRGGAAQVERPHLV